MTVMCRCDRSCDVPSDYVDGCCHRCSGVVHPVDAAAAAKRRRALGELNLISAQAVRELLAVLKEAGVSHFEQGDLKVTFAMQAPAPAPRVMVDDQNARALAVLADLAKQSAKAREA